MLSKEQRKNRVIVSGNNSSHSHIITGDCEITRKDGEIFIKASKNCFIKHLIEHDFVENGIETWTGEHKDIQLTEGCEYKYVAQVEFDAYEQTIRNVID